MKPAISYAGAIIAATGPPDPFENFRRNIEHIQRSLDLPKLQQLVQQVARAFDPADLQQLNARFAASTENLRQLSSRIAASGENLQQLQAHVRYPPEQIQQIADQIALNYPPDNLRRAMEQIQLAYTPDYFDGLSEQLAGLAQTGDFAKWRQPLLDASREFEAGAQAEGETPREGRRSLGSWLATRSLLVQVALLAAGLEVLDSAAEFIEEATGEDIPDPLQAATQACFAIVTFLLLWFSERDWSSDE